MFIKNGVRAVGACLLALGLSSASALASKGSPEAFSAVQAVCPGQTFAQAFSALGDSNFYTLVPGSEFNGSSEGWELFGGAQVLSSTHPDGTSGSALDLPSGSVAVSPPVCVTLQYPTARIWTQTVEGKSDVAVAVAYANTRTATKPRQVGSLQAEGAGNGDQEEGWQLSEPFEVEPQLGGKAEEVRQVRFIFAALGRNNDTQLYGLYVDPRMR
ncbi:MAG: hypothetical protein ACYDHN_17025 [Solirubrobacteraceae bacterium]